MATKWKCTSQAIEHTRAYMHAYAYACIWTLSFCFQFQIWNLSDSDGSINPYKHHECWQHAILLIDTSDDNLSINYTPCHFFPFFSAWHWAFHYFCTSNLEFRVCADNMDSSILECISSINIFYCGDIYTINANGEVPSIKIVETRIYYGV